MTTTEVVIFAGAFAAALSFLLGRNVTAGALVVAWLFGQWLVAQTGNSLPVEYYLYPDIAVIALILVKWELSVADKVVLLVFPVQWVFYVSTLHEYYRWHALAYLVVVQFLAAGLDGFLTWRRSASSRKLASRPPADDFKLLGAYPGGGRLG